ncbi:MAG: alpha/beta hydrolase [bacterium]|nr:alpha/beta hydrolase [bacterium]
MSEPKGQDKLTQEALSNWYVRLLANGITYFDATEVIPKVGSWDDWCRLWIERGDFRLAGAEEMARSGRRQSAAEGFVRAALAYHFAQFVYNEDPALKQEAQDKKVAAYQRALPDLLPPGERIEVPYESGNLPGILRIPAGLSKAPCVILISGLDSTKEEFHTLEAIVHSRGLATFAFDGPAQGERMDLPIEPAYEKPVSAVMDVLCKDARLDAERIGALGVSLGGHYAPRALAYEKRLKAAVGVTGFYDLDEHWKTIPALTRKGLCHAFGGVSEAEGAERAKTLSLRGHLKGLDRPLFIIHGELDRLCPVDQGHKIVEEAGPLAELKVYPEGVHVCNNVPFLWRPLAADWLADKLT